MSNFATTADLVEAVLRNAGEVTDGSSSYTDTALLYLDKFHRAFHAGSNEFDIDFGDVWAWAKADYPEILTLKAPYAAGTVLLTSGTTAGTFSVPPTESFEGRFLKLEGRPEFFRVKTHVTPFADFVLDGEYTDVTGAALVFKVIQTDFVLTPSTSQKVLRLVTPMVNYRSQGSGDGTDQIYGLEYPAFKRQFPFYAIAQMVPTHFTEVQENDGSIRVRFNGYVDTDTRVEYEFIPIPNALTNDDASIPRIPHAQRPIIENAATYKLMIDKEDDRAPEYLGWTKAGLEALRTQMRKTNTSTGNNRGRLLNRQNPRGRRPTNGYG